MTIPILEVKNLIKDYKKLRAVNDISFAIKPGICFGLLGPNGAGKTTTIEMIEGILKPTSGDILYKGHPRNRTFKQEIGIQLQKTELPRYLSVEETLKTFHMLYDNQHSLSTVIEICHLEEILQRDNRKISGGQRQRLLLGLALLNDPELLFLDEPTTGMDPQARRYLWDIVKEIKQRGKTVILTTHYMDEAEILSDELIIMDQGKIIAQGSPEALLQQYCPNISVFILKEHLKDEMLSHLPWKAIPHPDSYELQVTHVETCLKTLIELDIDLSEITIRHQNLEDLFLNLTGKSLRE